MSFIRRVIDAVHETDLIDARKQITNLNSEIKSYQQKGRKCIENKYKNFLPDAAENDHYILEGDNLIRDVRLFLDHIEINVNQDVDCCNEDVENLRKSLEENTLGLKTCLKLVKIETLLNEIRKINKLNRFNDATNILAELKTLIYDSDSNSIIGLLDCYNNIKIHYIQEHEHFLYNVHQKFESLVEFKDKTFQNTKAISIRISKDLDQLQETTVALVNTNYCPNNLCSFLLENVFEPICNRICTLNLDDTDPSTVKLLLSYNIFDATERPDYRIVFNNLKKVFQCLGYMNVNIDNENCVFSIIAENTKEKFLDLIINDCVSYAIPKTISEMKNSSIIEDIKKLHNFLCDMLFLNRDKQEDLRLIRYVDKIIVLFGKKFASKVLEEAISIMHKDLHDAKTVEKSFIIDSPLINCQVSKSTFQLLQLMEEVVENSKELTDQDGPEQLLNAVLLVLKRYGQEVCEYHKKLLENIPQQSALFHNNCKYIGEWIISHNDLKSLKSFENITQNLYDQGDENFKSQLNIQLKSLRENLDALELSELMSQSSSGPNRAIRQCLRQLEVLKNVWKHILPCTVFQGSMSLLLNEICQNITQKVIKMEDIPATLCTELEEIIALIEKKGPGLFIDPALINFEVKLWRKLVQLKIILGASLLQISELWREGTGPLVENFKSEEVKHMIRALFQNTDRRAAVISTII